LISEIEYKTTKSIFTVKANVEIKQMELQEKNFIVTLQEENLNISQKSNLNPLFVNPTQNISNI
jgi:hypothetical protein